MATSIKYSEYFGFTEEETAELYERYVSLEETPHFDFESLREWYNGYQTANGDRIFNPRAVICALSSNQIQSYWTGSGMPRYRDSCRRIYGVVPEMLSWRAPFKLF